MVSNLFKEAECTTCKKKGHLARMCQSKPQRPTPKNSQPALGLRLACKTHYVKGEDDKLTNMIFHIQCSL